MFNVVVLISGNGSNLQALIDESEKEGASFRITHVISDKATAYGLERASNYSIPTSFVNRKDFSSREEFDEAIYQIINNLNPDLVCLAGFMRLLSASFVTKLEGKLINIHPSILPAFKGTNSIAQALNEQVKFTGCTVHFVIPEMDAGPIIIQSAVPVLSSDSLEGLEEKIHKIEHKIYPLAVRLFAEKRIKVNGDNVQVDYKPENNNGGYLISC